MYIQLRNKPSAGPADQSSSSTGGPKTRFPSIRNVREVTRFLTHSNGDVEFRPWNNEELRLQSPPSDPDLVNHRIDLNAGFNRYFEEHVRKVRRANGCHKMHHNDARHLEKDDTMRKSFDATLQWIKETDFFATSSPCPPSSMSSSCSSSTSSSSASLSMSMSTTTASASVSGSVSQVQSSHPQQHLQQQQQQQKPALITTSTAIHQLLQLPYENEEKNCPSWLVSKYGGKLFLFSIETYTNPTLLVPNSDAGNNKFNIRHHHIFQSQHFHHNGHCNGHTNGNGCIDMGEKRSELLRYRSKVFQNLMTQRLPLDQLADKVSHCVLNRADFDGRTLIYSAVISAVDPQTNAFVDLKLTLNRKSKREHLEKMQRLWSMAVLKPAVRIVLGVRSGKSQDVNAVPDGRLLRIEDVDLKRLPYEVADFSHKSQFDGPLWQPRVSFEFLKRVLDYLDTRVMEDEKTVYQLVPEGFYGRGFSLLSIHKLNLRGCDPLIPEWFSLPVEQESRVLDVRNNGGGDSSSHHHGSQKEEQGEDEEEEYELLSHQTEVLSACLSETSISEAGSE